MLIFINNMINNTFLSCSYRKYWKTTYRKPSEKGRFIFLIVTWPSLDLLHLEGRCHEIFNFRFLSWISFPQTPEIRRDISSSRCTALKITLKCMQSDIVPILCHRCWYLWCTLTCKYLRKFSEKIEMDLMLFSRAWGNMIHEKSLLQKISWHCPSNVKTSAYPQLRKTYYLVTV